MKKNLGLLVILISILIATYFLQEKTNEKNFNDSLTSDRLILPGEFKQLSFSDIKAQKTQGAWWSEGKLLSTAKMSALEKKLSQIKKIKEITGEKSHFFNQKIQLIVNNKTWLLGDLTLDRQGFYVALEDELMVAIIEGDSGELTANPHQLQELKYLELQRLLASELSDMIETQLWRYYPQLPFEGIKISSEGRPAYELNFMTNQTTPPPLKGVEVHSHLGEKFKSLLLQANLKKEVPYTHKLMFSKLGDIKFFSASNQIEWELWLGGKATADAYILDHQQKKAWLMEGAGLKFFFFGVQEYWDKKVIPPAKFSNFSKISAQLSQEDKTAEVSILNREPLEFSSVQYKVDQENMNVMFQYIFNLAENDQAQRISPLSESEKGQVMALKLLRLKVMEQDLVLWHKGGELIVVNLTQGFKAHFLRADEKFRARFEDVLK
jgi:hypothetical protein